jgi:hypothetical protein
VLWGTSGVQTGGWPIEKGIAMSGLQRWLCAAAVVALFAAAGGSASANRLSMAGGAVSLASLGRVVFEPEMSEFNVSCNVTLNGSFIRGTFTKVRGTTVGTLSSATVRECTGGSITYSGFPVSITYESFEGTLPNITGIKFSSGALARLLVNIISGLRCRYREPMKMQASLARTERAGTVTMSLLTNVVGARLALEEERLNESILPCPLGLRLVFGLGIPSPISISLI